MLTHLMCVFYCHMKRLEKEQAVEQLAQDLKEAKSVTVVDYQGLGVKDLQGLRGELAKVGGSFTVVKNTLLKIALKNAGTTTEDETFFDGPTAIITAKEDEIAPLQVLAKMIKERELPKLKFGVFDSNLVNTANLNVLSKLPGKTTLYSQLVGTLVGPAYGLVGTLNAGLQQLVYILDQRSKQVAQ